MGAFIFLCTDIGQDIPVGRQIYIVLHSSFKSGFWGLIFSALYVVFTYSGKSNIKKINSIKDHFGIDYPDENK